MGGGGGGGWWFPTPVLPESSGVLPDLTHIGSSQLINTSVIYEEENGLVQKCLSVIIAREHRFTTLCEREKNVRGGGTTIRSHVRKSTFSFM